MREAANVLDLIVAKRRLHERDRAFLEAVTDALDEAADARSIVRADTVLEALDLNLQRAAEGYHTTGDHL